MTLDQGWPRRQLSYFFNPRSVAVIGASRDRHKLGFGVVRNLHEYHYRGEIYPVNPHARDVLGYPCYPDISAVPHPVDLAIVVVPVAHVIPMVEACGQHGVPAVVVVSTT